MIQTTQWFLSLRPHTFINTFGIFPPFNNSIEKDTGKNTNTNLSDLKSKNINIVFKVHNRTYSKL